MLDILFVYFNQSTYDSGDSILHYLQSKQSFEYQSYFLSVWAKPVFVLLSSPFAQFGFIGMKLFNTLCVLFTIYFSYKITLKRFPTYSIMMWVIGLFSVHLFLIQSSGLTEPLLALFLAAALYFYLADRQSLAAIIMSFTPMIRSEGWILLMVFFVWMAYEKQCKNMLLLSVGALIYSGLGYLYHHDFGWLFHQNPYVGVEEKYGSGELFHFVKQLPYLLGWPVAILLCFGLIHHLVLFIKSKFRFQSYSFLVIGCFLGLLVAHSLFWYFGLFHSFGLKRVLIAVAPCMILLAFDGFIWMYTEVKSVKYKTLVLLGFAAILIIFPFSKNKAGFEMPQDFKLEPSQILVKRASDWYVDTYPTRPTVSFGDYYFAETLGVDIDDTKEAILINAVKDNLIKPGTIVFWDDYFCFSDQGVDESYFDPLSYQILKKFEATNANGIHTNRIVVYLKSPTNPKS
ncbi:MAG: Gpi18-like mannosyltransferase [Bacteroidia bacterium]|jgi:Gpi18-like mannosyltransferase